MTRKEPESEARARALDARPADTARRRRGRLAAVLVAAAVTLSSTAGPAAAAEPEWPLQPGWPRDTDLASARPMNVPIEGSTGRSGWSKHSSPALADVDADGRPEIVVGSLDGRVYVYRRDGSLLWSRYLDAQHAAGPVIGSPAVGDIDGDGSLEVVVGSENGYVFAFDRTGATKAGWPQFTGWNADYPNRCATDACTGVVAGPTLADLDGNGTLEVIVGSYSHLMWVWNHRGQALPGWPVDVWDGIASGAAVGDINADGRPEIVVGSDVANDCADCRPYGRLAKGGLLHAFTIAGKEVAGWPFRTDSFMHSTPALADLDADGRLETIAGGGLFTEGTEWRGHHLWVVGHDGRLRWSFRADSVILSAPTVGDVNGDGTPEIAFGDYAGNTYLLNRHGQLMWKNNGVTARAPHGSGAHFGAPVLADVTGDGRAEVVATDSNWHVKAFDVPTGRVVADTGTTFPVWASAAVGDLDGDGTNEVVAGSAAQNGPNTGNLNDLAGAGRLYVWRTPGRGGLVHPQFQQRVTPIDRSLAPRDPSGSTASVYRFWSPGFDNAHFFTTSGSEAVRIIDTDVNWVYEGRAFGARPAPGGTCTSGGSPVHRFWSAGFRSHFYTQSEAERARIVATDRNWAYEGVAYCAYAQAESGTVALHRFWSPGFGKHFFTASAAEADHIRANDRNWTYEGVAYHVLP